MPVKIHQNGMVFYGSPITGPTCNFLHAEFGLRPLARVDISPQDGSRVCEIHQTLQDICRQFASLLPVHGLLHLHRLKYDPRDTASVAHYSRLLHLILEAAEEFAAREIDLK